MENDITAEEWFAPHLPVRSAITKAIVCRTCHAVLATAEQQTAPCPEG